MNETISLNQPEIDKYKNIIWDWNGTILDDSWLCVNVINSILKEKRIPVISEEIYSEKFTIPIRDFYTSIGISFDKESYSELTELFFHLYESEIHKCVIRPVVIKIIRELANSEANQFLLSLTKEKNLLKAVSHFDLGIYFCSISGLADHKGSSKVSIGMKLMVENNIINNETLLIGDTIHDFHVANSLKVDCVLIPSGYQSISRLIRSGARVCMDTKYLSDYIKAKK